MAKHPVHNLPISQAAYLAELLTDYPRSIDELYREMVEVWPSMQRDRVCGLVRRLKNTINARTSDRGVWLSKGKYRQVQDHLWLEKVRVKNKKTSKKTAIISIKKI